jgi:hypothetical protein
MAAMANDVPAPGKSGMGPRQIVEFFVLVPLAVGLFLGAARLGAYQFETVGHHMAYLSLYSVLSWACYGVGSKAAAWILRPWSPPLLAVLAAGNVVGGMALLWPLRDLLNRPFAAYLLPGSSFGAFWPPPADNLGSYIAISLQGMAWWMLANWADFRFRGVPRFGFVPSPAAQPAASAAAASAAVASANPAPASPGATATAAAPAPSGATGSVAPQAGPTNPAPAGPRLAGRLPERLRTADIQALEAEEHYTKVHTSCGNALLLIRFSDAIAEMEPQPGLQVHRSFWISRSAVERVLRIDRRLFVRLRGGFEVPVSRSFRLSVRAAGLPGGAAADE